MTTTVAVVAADLAGSGGVRTVFDSFVSAIAASPDFRALPISVATSRKDRASRALTAPQTWLRGPQVLTESDDTATWRHVGSPLADIEWIRFAPHRRLTELLREADIVQVIAGSPAWGLIAVRSGRPVCLQVATMIAFERGRPVGSPLVRQWRALMTAGSHRLDQRALRRVDHVLVENRQMQQIADRYAPGRVSVIYPGTDTEVFHPPDRYCADGPVIAVGRLDERRKDWPLLFAAYARAKTHLPSLPDLLLAGRGQLSADDRRCLRELDLERCCTIVSDPTRDELAKLYRGASMLVLSSREEGLGLVVVEAMASGLPVVATRLAGTVETVADGQSGLLVDRGADEAASLGHAIVTLAESAPLRRSMGSFGRERAVRRFSRSGNSAQILDVYRTLLTAPARVSSGG